MCSRGQRSWVWLWLNWHVGRPRWRRMTQHVVWAMLPRSTTTTMRATGQRNASIIMMQVCRRAIACSMLGRYRKSTRKEQPKNLYRYGFHRFWWKTPRQLTKKYVNESHKRGKGWIEKKEWKCGNGNANAHPWSGMCMGNIARDPKVTESGLNSPKAACKEKWLYEYINVKMQVRGKRDRQQMVHLQKN